MNLSFSTHWGKRMGNMQGKPTYFVEKILAGLLEDNQTDSTLWDHLDEYYSYAIDRGNDVKSVQDVIPKLHTIREDKNNKWKVGNKIHFCINNRTPDRLQFAPVILIKSIQEIEIIYNSLGTPFVYIGESPWWLNELQIEKLARNDGFKNIQDFFKWFNKDFSGYILHWSNLKY